MVLNTSGDATCDESFVENNSRYEKSNVIERCCSGRVPDAGFMLEHARDHHDHNASNHSRNGSPATGSRFADDDDNAYGRRLLIAKVGRG